MSIEAQVEEIIIDVLRDRYGIPLRQRTTPIATCETCGAKHKQNLDIYGKPNGYCAHDVGQCLQNLHERISRLEG